MPAGALRALEFDRIVSVVAGLAVTPPGRDRLTKIRPLNDTAEVRSALRSTSEGARFLADQPGFPLRARADLPQTLEALSVDGRALEPLQLTSLSDFLESVEQSKDAVARLGSSFPILLGLVDPVASFRSEIVDVRRKIDASGELADNASPALAGIRDRLRRQRARLRSTLESVVRGRDTAKYLQEQVITDRSGRYVLMVRTEHRSAIPGIVHGGSTSGASLFIEPLQTVEINNGIVELEEKEAKEVHRILLALTDTFRRRSDDLDRTIAVSTELDVIQARAHFSLLVGGVEPTISTDGTFELRGARHPLLMRKVQERLVLDVEKPEAGPPPQVTSPTEPVPVDITLAPPTRVLVITGPNTGGKTVALKTAGLLAAMAQAGLHLPVDPGSAIPVFRSLFADIGDEQSIAASLSTFSAHVANVVSMDRELELPALVLLDEVGAGTDPAEGGALGTAVIDHFRRRGAHLVATTHYDSLKSYASTTDGVASAAFGFDPDTFAPTYSLIYGSPGRSLAIEIGARLGMPESVIAAARGNLSEREQRLADHLARVDTDLRRLEKEQRAVARERAAVAAADKALQAREQIVREREEPSRTRLSAKLDSQVREARREIDTVVDALKERVAELTSQAARHAATVNTGDAGAVRARARTAVDEIAGRVKRSAASGAAHEPTAPRPATRPSAPLRPGATVVVGALGLEGVLVELHPKHGEVDVRGKRLRVALDDLLVTGGPPATTPVRVNIDLQPREGSLSELNVVGCTVDEALTRVDKFLDEVTVTDQHVVRLIHGHGTGQLRRALRAFLQEHPLVTRVEPAPPNKGGGGVTVVELKD